MQIALKEVHVGKAIKEEMDKQKMTKSEFGRLVGIPQQHVNRVLERPTMETAKLCKVCLALDFNFFSLFCDAPPQVINAYLAAVAMKGDAHNIIGSEVLQAQLELERAERAKVESELESKKELVETLQSQLKDKDVIIELLKGGKR